MKTYKIQMPSKKELHDNFTGAQIDAMKAAMNEWTNYEGTATGVITEDLLEMAARCYGGSGAEILKVNTITMSVFDYGTAFAPWVEMWIENGSKVVKACFRADNIWMIGGENDETLRSRAYIRTFVEE